MIAATITVEVRESHARSLLRQDLAFEAISELRLDHDAHQTAVRLDDQESALERDVFRAMANCRCQCCRQHLPRLLMADRYDAQERALVVVGDEHCVSAARYTRTLSRDIDAERAALKRLVDAARTPALADGMDGQLGLPGRWV